MIGAAKRAFTSAGRSFEAAFDAARFRLKVRLGRLERIEILPYRGHGTSARIFLKGRVLEASGITPSTQTDTMVRNIKNMARRFFSSEAPHARVVARFGGQETEATADEEGFFDVRFDLREAPQGVAEDTEWHPVSIELVAPLAPGQRGERAMGQVLIPDGGAGFAIISDVDDTVVLSSAASVLKMAWIVATGNAHTRLPFSGVGALYEALRRGGNGTARNPLFYVSSSPWNIYDVLEDFMDVHGLPTGPIFLKDWSPTVLGKHEDHKLELIRRLLATYPDLPFVLLGDSGQEDPEIYAQAAAENPERIKAVFIRDVTGAARREQVESIAASLPPEGAKMHLLGDSGEAAEIAARMELIARRNVRKVYENLP